MTTFLCRKCGWEHPVDQTCPIPVDESPMTPKPSKEAMETAELYLATHRADLPMEANVEALAVLIDRALSAHASKYEKIARELHEALRKDYLRGNDLDAFWCRYCRAGWESGESEHHEDVCPARPFAELIGGGE